MNTDHSQTQASPMQDMGNGILLENQESAHWSTYHGRTLLNEKLATFQMDQGDGRIQLLMAIPGVVDCSVQRYSVHVRKSPAFSWNEIHPAVLAAMDQFQSVPPQDKRLSKQSLLSRIRLMQTEVECDFGYAIDPHAGPNQVKGKGDRMNQLYGQWHALGKLALMIERDLIGGRGRIVMDTQHMLDMLRSEVSALNALLADPQPGLFTWCEAVANRWAIIAQLWSRQKK